MIRVMSFNIRYGAADDGANCWDNRKALAVARIQAFDPDLLGIQECRDDAQADFVRNSLQGYEFYGVRREGGGSTALEMAPALFRQSTFRIVQRGYFWLSETPHEAGSKSWDSVFARTATWVELAHRPTGRSVVFLNTHFDYRPLAIKESARLLQQWVDQTARRHPIIVTGDFNADKNSTAYQQLTGGGLFDVYRRAHPDRANEATSHGFGQPSKMAPIDWILASDHFEVVDAAVDLYHEGGLYPSDHYPVTAVLDWKDRTTND